MVGPPRGFFATIMKIYFYSSLTVIPWRVASGAA